MVKRFLDTNAILEDCNDLTNCIISSKTIEELESIKTNRNKSDEIQYKARQAVKAIIRDNPDVVIVTEDDYNTLANMKLECNNDNLIISTAKRASLENENPVVFVTNDYLCGLIAENYFGLTIERTNEDKAGDSLYKGYKIVTSTDEELAKVYSKDDCENIFDCLVNEYVIINDSDGNFADVLKWTGTNYISVYNKNFKSRQLGTCKPLDVIQRMAFDSLINNDVTVLYGRSGSGKTTIPLSYIMQCLESGKYKKCVIIYDFETLRGAKTLGFTPGTLNEKIVTQGAIGNILSSKFGDMSEVERLLASGIIEIIPTANIRGYEISQDEICFCTEAQNLDVYTLKTIIQRCKAGSKIIFEGDIIEQHDSNREIGLLKMIDVFKDYKSFGCVKLKNNYRSEIGELADLL